jgi:hypothetical protein
MKARAGGTAVAVVLRSAWSRALAAVCGPVLVAAQLLCPAPAAADESASLANVLLVEQLADVATTQQLLRTTSCGPTQPIIDAARRPIGATRHCVAGTEVDPLARPFVGSPLVNVGTAVALNGLVRLASHALLPHSARWLRLAVVLYPAVIVGNVSSTIDAQRFAPSAAVFVQRHF